MDLLNSYFKNLVFTKIEKKENFVIYGAGIACGLGGGKKRYVLLFVPEYLANKNKARIYELKWQNLQTRELSYSYNLRPQPWSLPRDVEDVVLEVKHRSQKSSTYQAYGGNFPFEILLLHDPKKKTIYQYRNKLTLTAAIEMFNSIFNYVDDTFENYVPAPRFTPQTNNMEIPSVGNWFNPGNVNDSFELIE